MSNKIIIASVVVLYNPTELDLQNVLQMAYYFKHVWVYDNSSNNNLYKRYFGDSHFTYISFDINNGLAIPYNLAIKAATESGIKWLMLLDQDSFISREGIDNINDYVSKCNDKTIAIVAPQINYGRYFNCISEDKKVKWVINSGATLNLSLLNEYNIRFDENYFLDRLDADFDNQISDKRLTIIQLKKSILEQRLGEESGFRHTNHSAVRHYYIFRNRFYYNAKYYKGIHKIFLNLSQTIRHIVLILLFEDNKIQKLHCLPLAFSDYRKKIYGKKIL